MTQIPILDMPPNPAVEQVMIYDETLIAKSRNKAKKLVPPALMTTGRELTLEDKIARHKLPKLHKDYEKRIYSLYDVST